MKQNRGESATLQFIKQYGALFLHGTGQATIGFIWWTFLCCFLAFFYNYNWYYNQGIRLKNSNHALMYYDLDSTARRIACAFLMFLIFSYTIFKTSYEGFAECLWIGGLVTSVVLPTAHYFYSQEHRYQFKMK